MSAADIDALKRSSYRKACMASKGWQQASMEVTPKLSSASVLDWGSQGPGQDCRTHSQCAENLYCREQVCVPFASVPWGGMGEDEACSFYYDCNLGLLCRKEVCVAPAGDAASRKGARCADHYQCGNGLLCRSGACTPADSTGFASAQSLPTSLKQGDSCTDHYQCARGMLCLAGRCN